MLVDTNTIIESHRVGSWRALAGGFRVETVEDCVTETQTGFQRRRKEQSIDAKELRGSLAAIYAVEDREHAELAVRKGDIALDEGEEALWAHALGRNDVWVLCGPDTASLRCGVRLGFRERVVSLGEVLDGVRNRPKVDLRRQYTKKWLDKTLGIIILEERGHAERRSGQRR